MISVLAALLVAAAPTPVPAPPPPPPLPGEVEVEGLEVRVKRPDRLLSVAVSGDADVDTLVASVPRGVYCSALAYQYARGPIRLCWLRARRKTEVLLRALAPGAFGRDWTVQWSGCEPMPDPSWCRVRLDDARKVAAVFRRSPG